MIIQNFDLNLIPDSAPVVVHCDQYDHGTGRLVIHLHDGVTDYEPTGSAIIQGVKPDMHGFAYDATLSGNTVTADLTEQMTAVDGAVQCQVVVTETTGRTGTFVFTLSVQRSALPDDTSLSDSDYQLIEDALEAAEDSEAWAVGERGGVPVPAGDPTYNNNSKYWADIASQYAQGGLIYKGSCLFANIPTTDLTSGDMWNIEDDFTTDSRFQEGAGIFVKAGTNIAWNGLKWDLLATGGGGVPIPVYYVQVSATPTSSSPIVIAGLDFSKVFKLIVSTSSTTPVSLGSIYINNGTSTKRYYAYSKRTDSTGLTNVTSYMDICYGSASYCAALEFLCQSNKDNTYLAIYAGDDYVPTNLNALSDVTLGTLADGQVLKYDATTQKWVNGTGGGGGGVVPGAGVFYGTCASLSASQNKEITCAEFTANDYVAGTMLVVHFANSNAVNYPTLTIAGITKDIVNFNQQKLWATYSWTVSQSVLFVYNGNEWMLAGAPSLRGDSSKSGLLRLSSSTSSTSDVNDGIAATPAAVKTAYDLADSKPDDLTELGDVAISATPSNNDVLQYDSTAQKWSNSALDLPAYTSAVTGSVGATSVTITDASITASSVLELFTQNTSGTPMSYTNVSVTSGSVTYTFDALTEATDFKVRITNL